MVAERDSDDFLLPSGGTFEKRLLPLE
ncbi:hypothetical protein RvY_01171 [Ramazzottius varieornatus]|uniref:Uncharacterized protein n=1 Tax=Ramazzottius varieornatus TaxID=947166 RepID=A0A1D1UFD1_RAMVA|nr:hypothetical protein RvY_01171 [Ramazzottius varieornatus]